MINNYDSGNKIDEIVKLSKKRRFLDSMLSIYLYKNYKNKKAT